MHKKLRIGIWANYGLTLTPTEGIGVLIFNLIDGMCKLPEPPKIVFVVNPVDGKPVSDFLYHKYGNKIKVILPHPTFLDKLVYHLRQIYRSVFSLRSSLKSRIRFPLIFSFIIRIPYRILMQMLYYMGNKILQIYFSKIYKKARVSKYGDILIFPYFGISILNLDVPSIVIINDLVYRHYPEGFAREKMKMLDNLANENTKRAVFSVCASRFILETDLLGELNLPREKTRLIKLAPPIDILADKPIEFNELSKRFNLKGNYIFYPSAFRAYKNHIALIKAVSILRTKYNIDIKAIFTGIVAPPSYIREAIREFGLNEEIIILGKVSRSELAGLYKSAIATIIPSLYEQGSFQVFEALTFGCPVACSNIPSLIEQHEDCLDKMLFFNPNDPDDIAKTILYIMNNREKVITDQRIALMSLQKRTWKDVAEDFLDLCYEAVERNKPF